VTTVALLVAVLLVTAGCEPRRSLTGWLPYWSTSSATAGVSANSDLFAELSPFWFRATGTTTFANDATTSDQAKVVALVLRGYSTKQIVSQLAISQYTVQDAKKFR